MESNLIEVKGLTKAFDKVIANDHVDFCVKNGEIHALLGENGAGKSTLISMLSGIYNPDSGSIFIEGNEVELHCVKDAVNAGIGTIYQHLKLVDAMKAKDNIVLGQEKKVFKSYKKIYGKAKEVKELYDINIDLDKYVYDMTVGERQNLEILKVLNRGARILILDEPTSVFTPQESKKLFHVMKKLKEQGCAVIFITHKLDEVMEVADRVTILRGGKTIKTVDIKDANPKILTDLMMGESIDLAIDTKPCMSDYVRLKVKDLTINGQDGRKCIDKVSFSIREGEVLGVAGIAGCGQKELCEAIAGIVRTDEGNIYLDSEDLTGKNAEEFSKRGIALSFIPEDRIGMGLVGSRDIVDNLLLREYKKSKGLFVNRKILEAKANAIVKEFEVKTPGIHYPIKYLSGGNIQKILLGRELGLSPKVLVMAYPVRGLDIKTCYTIYDLITKEKAKGTSILFIGEDLDVLMQLSDRIMVLNQGRVTGIEKADSITKDKIGLLMVGRTEEGGEDGVNTAS